MAIPEDEQLNSDTLLSDFIMKLTASTDATTNWNTLLEALRAFGIDRVMYGKKLNFHPENVHNHSRSIVLSSYGAELDQKFLLSRGYLDSPTVQWAMHNYGCISWGETRQRALAGELTKKQMDVYEATRQLGLLVGLTYCVPTYTDTYRSVFGLAFRPDITQQEADAVWHRNSSVLEPLLCAFDLAFAQFKNVPDDQELDDKTLYFMSLIAEGRTTAEVAEIEGCHYRTVEQRLMDARQILGANNTLHAISLAKDQGQL